MSAATETTGTKLGALVERDFRLLFSATTITGIGDRLAAIALAFAVLDLGSATDLGIVLAVRQGLQAAVTLGGGVLADRLPRNLVLVGASIVQAAAQAVTAALVLGGSGSIAAIAAAQAVYGIGSGVVVPAEVGLVPQTVSPERLQQANALQGLSRNVVGILGPAVGGALVVAGSPGVALAVDAASFVICAWLLGRIRVAARVGERPGFLRELREGWSAFRCRSWLWTSVVLIGLSNMFYIAAISVIGPLVAKAELGGARAWATILTVGGVGAVVGGVAGLRYRPRLPFVASVVAALPLTLQIAALALGWPVWAIAGTAFVGAIGLSLHLTLWFTVFQREVPEELQSRVSSYDALFSIVLVPAGLALAGPAAHWFGIDTFLWTTAAVFVAVTVLVLLVPSGWTIRDTR